TTLDDETYDGGTLAQETADGTGLSLREALGLVNADGGTHTITFAPSLAGGALYLADGELDITSNVTIEGDIDGNATPDIAISGTRATRVFDVGGGPSITATLDGLVIINGVSGSGKGSGIEVGPSDALFLKNSQVTHNHALISGGGINGEASSEIVLINTTVSGNRSDHVGGGLYAGPSATLSLVNSTISDNDSGNNGGGIDLGYLASGTFTNATLAGNSSGDKGAGIYGDRAQIRLY